MAISLQTPDFGVPAAFDDTKFFFESFQNFLTSGQPNADTTAVNITKFISTPSEAEAKEAVEGSMGLIWRTLIHVVKQIPYKHPWQERLVDLLAAIKRVTLPTKPGSVDPDSERAWVCRNWSQLPFFGRAIRESWNEGPWIKYPEHLPDPFPDDDTFSPDEWANLNAFIARITDTLVLNFDTYASWILRHTLEEERHQEEIENNVPAAATWVEYAGRRLYHNAAREDNAPPEVYQSPQMIVYLRKFSKRFSKERWGYWKERFDYILNNQNLNQNARCSAGEALNQMTEIESHWPEPLGDVNGPAQPHSGLMLGVGAGEVSL